jgi:hypothetical protein
MASSMGFVGLVTVSLRRSIIIKMFLSVVNQFIVKKPGLQKRKTKRDQKYIILPFYYFYKKLDYELPRIDLSTGKYPQL